MLFNSIRLAAARSTCRYSLSRPQITTTRWLTARIKKKDLTRKERRQMKEEAAALRLKATEQEHGHGIPFWDNPKMLATGGGLGIIVATVSNVAMNESQHDLQDMTFLMEHSAAMTWWCVVMEPRSLFLVTLYSTLCISRGLAMFEQMDFLSIKGDQEEELVFYFQYFCISFVATLVFFFRGYKVRSFWMQANHPIIPKIAGHPVGPFRIHFWAAILQLLLCLRQWKYALTGVKSIAEEPALEPSISQETLDSMKFTPIFGRKDRFQNLPSPQDHEHMAFLECASSFIAGVCLSRYSLIARPKNNILMSLGFGLMSLGSVAVMTRKLVAIATRKEEDKVESGGTVVGHPR